MYNFDILLNDNSLTRDAFSLDDHYSLFVTYERAHIHSNNNELDADSMWAWGEYSASIFFKM